MNNEMPRPFTYLILIAICNTLFWIFITKISFKPRKKANQDITGNTNKTIDMNLKYILLWTSTERPPFDYLETGQVAFFKHSCRCHNCYVTNDRKFLSNITQFHAIAFNGNKCLGRARKDELPEHRSYHQKYIFYNTESSFNQPLCQPYYDSYFNWTATFKLKSDLVTPYIQCLDNDKFEVAPALKPDWIPFEKMSKVDPSVKDIIRSKHRAAAWFVSNCVTYSKREEYVKKLNEELSVYNMTVDVYGACGVPCPRGLNEMCMENLKREYYFSLAFENSVDEDYVTEKVLSGFQHYTVPIVYGGATYERFLPPHSYIDASLLKQKDLASLMVKLMESPSLYLDYFRWKNHYSYQTSLDENCVCSLCAALNDINKMEYSSYPNLRRWWNPNFSFYCHPELLGN